MKTFVATVEERYVWDCPYCGEINEDDYQDPEEEEFVTCEYCDRRARCEHTER